MTLNTSIPLVIQGSSRKNSDTQKLVELVFDETEITLVELLDYSIAKYNYDEEYPAGDDFLKIVDLMIASKLIVFATPVYWYAMGGYMKVFFDRLSDIVGSQKHLGRKLKGKNTALIIVSADEELPEGFEIPFKRTSEYLDMDYQGCFFQPESELGKPSQSLIKKAAEWRDEIVNS